MKQCEKCRITVASSQIRCPLCQRLLSDIGGEVRETFPSVPTVYKEYHMFFKVTLFLSALAAVICLAINILCQNNGWWSLFVLAGLGAMWLAIIVACHKRSTISKRILYQAVVLSLILVLSDYLAGFYRWSFNFAIPLMFIFTMPVILAISLIQRRHFEEYAIYIVVNALFGAVPLIFLLTGLAKVLWPSVISAAVSVMTIVAILIFRGPKTRAELNKRLHM